MIISKERVLEKTTLHQYKVVLICLFGAFITWRKPTILRFFQRCWGCVFAAASFD
jgi:hypothetical protein